MIIIIILVIIGFLLSWFMDSKISNNKKHNLEIEDWQQKLVDKGIYDNTSFEEEELEEDDYYYEDDK